MSCCPTGTGKVVMGDEDNILNTPSVAMAYLLMFVVTIIEKGTETGTELLRLE